MLSALHIFLPSSGCFKFKLNLLFLFSFILSSLCLFLEIFIFVFIFVFVISFVLFFSFFGKILTFILFNSLVQKEKRKKIRCNSIESQENKLNSFSFSCFHNMTFLISTFFCYRSHKQGERRLCLKNITK